MRIRRLAPFFVPCAALFGCQQSGGGQPPPDLEPPVAKVEPKQLAKHGHVRTDPYHWLNRRDDDEVIGYLEAENHYTQAMMAHTVDLQELLFEEFKGRIKQTDMSVPYKQDDYYYYSRTEDGKEYAIHCRKKGSLDAEEEIMLDVNELAEGHDYFAVGRRAVSYNQDILAYPVDTVGRRKYTVHFKNLVSGELYADTIPEVTANLAWANDNKTLFYTKQDPVTLRAYQIWRHTLGSDASEDVLVYEEKDETFSSWIFKTKSKRYLVIRSSHTVSDEARFLEADDPTGQFEVFLPRKRDHEYSIDHYQDHFYIRTNHAAKNFRLMRTPVERTALHHWEEVIPHRDDVLLEGFEIFRNHLVLEERRDGLMQLRIRDWAGEADHYIDFGEPAYLAFTRDNRDFDTAVLRYHYESMTTPDSVYDYDMNTREATLLKREEVLGGFDSDDYATERLTATARDGARIPISVVYRKGVERNAEHPLVLYGYGSYGASMDASFSAFRVSLLDRGFIYAIAHVRGGEELGRQWYEDGKLFNKKNTFNDFIDVGEHLVAERYTRPDRLFCWGGSAGGLLVGAVINLRPDLFKGCVAAVPFVDVVTTMLDDSIPLTTSEYDEWGDPNDAESYQYILSYSPYDNVTAQHYPDLLVTTGLHDSQVQYWEPAKWVAKLRATKTGDGRVLLKTEMEAGHGGVSGRYKRYRDIAFQYAFLLDRAGIRR